MECTKENQNEPLEAFYEPDITATLILNESELLLKNLNNLKLVTDENGNKNYILKETSKKPEKINKKVQKEYKELNNCIESSIMQCQGIMANFMNEIREGN